MYEYTKYRLELVRENTTMSEHHYKISNPNDMHKFLVDICRINYAPQEVFIVVALNAKGNIVGYHTVSIGDISASIVHPREVFKYLVTCNACGTILCHNHPSEDPTPSGEDIKVTQRLVSAGELLGINVLDHIIVGNETEYVSLKQEGYI